MTQEKNALVLFAHGSRDPAWAAPFRAIQQRVVEARPGATVELAFLEMMQPTLAETLDRLAGGGHTQITIAPLFMAQGAHLKRDLAAILATSKERHPHVQFTVLPAAGEVEPVADSIGTWLSQHV